MADLWQGELCLLRSNGEINTVFLFTGRNMCSCFPLRRQVDFPSLTKLKKISHSCNSLHQMFSDARPLSR